MNTYIVWKTSKGLFRRKEDALLKKNRRFEQTQGEEREYEEPVLVLVADVCTDPFGQTRQMFVLSNHSIDETQIQ